MALKWFIPMEARNAWKDAKRRLRGTKCRSCGYGLARLLDQTLGAKDFSVTVVCRKCGKRTAVREALSGIAETVRHHVDSAAAAGAPLNFRGILNEPKDELGVVIMFGRLMDDLGMEYVSKAPSVADAVLRVRKLGRWTEQVVEFEFRSRSALSQGNDIPSIDMIICWENNWRNPPAHLKIIALRDLVAKLRG